MVLDADGAFIENTLFSRWLSSGLLCRLAWKKFTDVSEVLAADIIKAMCKLRRSSNHH
jgi:hypothetical protein